MCNIKICQMLKQFVIVMFLLGQRWSPEQLFILPLELLKSFLIIKKCLR